MNIKEPVVFMTNLVLVARADKKLSPSESALVEEIRKDLKLKKSDLSAAEREAERGLQQLKPLGSLVESIVNLDAMLRVAHADDDPASSEIALIRDFCLSAGIPEDQLVRIKEEVAASMAAQTKQCGSCGVAVEPDCKFCPQCGANMATADRPVVIGVSIPQTGIALEFAESTAAAFPQALELAKAVEGFQSYQKGKKCWYLAPFPSGDVKDALPLAEAISGIRNRVLYVDGQEKQWEEVFGFTWCAARRATAFNPVEYCFGKDENRLNPWGCKQARMDWSEWADWFSYGHWEKTGLLSKKTIWHFDKHRIKHELATNLFRFRFCPHILPALPDAILKHLPDTVQPDTDRNWAYHQRFEEVPGAVRIIEKTRQEDIEFTQEYWAAGVRPKGLAVLADLLTKALRDTGGNPDSAKALVR